MPQEILCRTCCGDNYASPGYVTVLLAIVLGSEFLYMKYPPYSLNLAKTEPELK